MKVNSKARVLALVISALMLVSMIPLTASAAATLTMGEITQAFDGTDFTFTVPYTATDVAQVTVLAAKSNEDTAPAVWDENNIVYVDQQAATVGSFTFKVAAADVVGCTKVYIKLGGTAVGSALNGKFDIETEPIEVVLGDVNGDGEVTGMDAALVLQYSLEIIPELIQFDAADVNGDGEVTGMDAALILQYSLEIIPGFPTN